MFDGLGRFLIISCLFFSLSPATALSSQVDEGQEIQKEQQSEDSPISEESVVHEDPAEEPLLSRLMDEAYLEDTRKAVADRVVRLADRIDSLFGDRRYDDRSNTSTLRISQNVYLLDGSPDADNPSVNLNLHLPNLKELERRIWKRLTPDTPLTPDGDSEAVVEQPNPWRLNQETGVVVAWPLDYFLRLRLRKDFHTGVFLHSFYEQVGWSKKNEWEEKTSLTSDYAIRSDLLFRFVNEKDWAMTHHELATRHGPSLLQQLSAVSAISYDLRYTTALKGHDFYSSRASLGSTYRTQLKLPWMYLELTPELAWESETSFKPLYNLYVKFEVVFGNI